MIRVGNTIVSLDLFSESFCCDLPVCRGNCCRYGDAGAPVTNQEVEILNRIFPVVKGYMRNEGIAAVDESGTSVIDNDGELVTTLIDGRECAYTGMSDGVFYCAIERAWSEKKVDFRKPLSCHLFPLRIKNYNDFTAVNYEQWDICSGGRKRGVSKNLRLAEYLSEPLARAFGKEWVKEMNFVWRELKSSGLAE